MPEDKLIDPAWLVKARVDRKKFAVRVVIVFAILSILAWWALPNLTVRATEVAKISRKASIPGHVQVLLGLAGWFKALWAAIAIGCGVAIGLAFTGKIDSLIPVLSIGVLLLGAGAIGLTFYVFYAPMLILVEGIR